MKKLLFAILAAVVLASAVWTYKGIELQDNQVLVFITGTELAPSAEQEIRHIEPGEAINLQINGRQVPCRYTRFNVDSKAGGTVSNGYLVNGVDAPLDSQFIVVGANTVTNDAHWGTIELINSLEIGACAVFAKAGSKLQVNDLSLRNGGRISGHRSHQRGLDADLRFMCREGSRIFPCTDHTKFDEEVNWLFVKTLATQTPVQFVFLDQRLINKLRSYAEANDPDPQLVDDIFAAPLLFHVNGHLNHFHMRIHCPPGDNECSEQRGGWRGGPARPEEIETEQEAEQVAEPETIPGAQPDEVLMAKVNPTATNPSRCLLFADLNPIITHCSNKYGINENLIKAVILAESGGYCRYGGGDPNAVSRANAIGLMQVLDKAVEDVNYDRLAHEQFNWPGDARKPAKNICAGTQYLAILWTRYGSSFGINTINDLVQAYNVGPGNYKNGVKNQVYLDMVRDRYGRIVSTTWPPSVEQPGLSVSRRGQPLIT
ncbi:penicillin-insensitive murein endopeptidase [Candidatus Micrarchaeota archaeon]|nr:penicillin-insensitive murein endopeptidase [Candidatus Micrarchaeota archaeon]